MQAHLHVCVLYAAIFMYVCMHAWHECMYLYLYVYFNTTAVNIMFWRHRPGVCGSGSRDPCRRDARGDAGRPPGYLGERGLPETSQCTLQSAPTAPTVADINLGLVYQNPRTVDSMAHLWSCRVCIINSIFWGFQIAQSWQSRSCL